ncbi:ABC transporter substrate-binding protein [Romeria aff. gracilis LEGE 07310]|uniref:non-specific serine/threonine protein kinase n=1 Tax=Vasconcelosia minhoensis LEGE 07310 TaxID=915328 RepID=A0A8J7DRS7_9CYAN|nr:bifunctional serine/threonine-protein kinase/ABC transporter substrate-binding protein [Romeria gracilis]MBE9079249.1 ABC transporter substrate-binding protein [Romeria aff. gracilis LEGE 07310]
MLIPYTRGHALSDRYQILSTLGQGSTGHTYKAQMIDLDCPVAIKVLSLKQIDDWKMLDLFEREAQVLKRLDHPGIPRYIDYFQTNEDADQHFHLVQSLAAGESLANLVKAGRQFGETEIVEIAQQILTILQYLHTCEPAVIHRDIKPDNLIYQSQGQLSLVDFGAVKNIYRQTAIGSDTLVGTLDYMPPEQLRGQACFASDLYSLGLTLLFLALGESPETLPRWRNQIWFRSRVSLSPVLCRWLERLLQPDLEDRFRTVQQAQSALNPVRPNRQKHGYAPDIAKVKNSHADQTPRLKDGQTLSNASIVSFVVFVALCSATLFRELAHSPQPTVAVTAASNSADRSDPNPDTMANRLSFGERSLLPQTSDFKQLAIAAYADSRYSLATDLFEALLGTQRNDPEALIYLNNARIGERRAYTFAVAAPLKESTNPALEILRGMAQVQDEVNRAGGIAGIPLKVLIVNDDNNPIIARQLAHTLTSDPSILAVIGHFSSDTTLAAAPVYQQKELPMVSPTSTSVEISSLGDYIFRTAPSDRFAASALASYQLETLHHRKAAIFYNSESNYSQSLKHEFTKALYSDGGEVVSEFDLTQLNTRNDAARAVQRARQAGAEVLMLAANTPTLDPVLGVIAANQGELPLLGGDSLYNPKILDRAGPAATQLVVAIPWHLQAHRASAFAQRSHDYWGGDVSWRTATTYDAAQAIVAALQHQPSRKGIEAVLSGDRALTEGATQSVKFLPSGDRNQRPQLVTVRQGDRSGYGYDFVPLPE